MHAGSPTIAAPKTALCARRDLLLEILALRHQLTVRRRSDRRFRLTDLLFWLCLRRWWPRWRHALVLVQPATVARWHRERLRWMLEPPTAAATGQTVHRRPASSPHSAYGHGEPSLGCSTNPRRVAETRTSRL